MKNNHSRQEKFKARIHLIGILILYMNMPKFIQDIAIDNWKLKYADTFLEEER